MLSIVNISWAPETVPGSESRGGATHSVVVARERDHRATADARDGDIAQRKIGAAGRGDQSGALPVAKPHCLERGRAPMPPISRVWWVDVELRFYEVESYRMHCHPALGQMNH